MADVRITLYKLAEYVRNHYQFSELPKNLYEAMSNISYADLDGNNTLDKKEIEELKLSEEIMKEICTTEDGEISETVPLRKLLKHILLPKAEEHWERLFNIVDKDRSGYIETDEMETYLALCGVLGAESEKAMNTIKSFDSDNDMKFSFKEFSEYLKTDFCNRIDELVPAVGKGPSDGL
ncbi:16 kDa calcium-binding protein-like [Tubulanus polymorphus]|uniref:16 kDa calcium-binding protein-like n=1 Tax=Tubulanus polymorphus TaxID=672921 RepID=UPI003DA2E8DF